VLHLRRVPPGPLLLTRVNPSRAEMMVWVPLTGQAR
jgi:hypothetical protein